MATALSTFTGADGNAWSSEWVLGTSTGASAAVLNSNRGRMTLSQAGSYTDRMTQRLVAAGQWADVILRGTVEFPNLTSENFGQAWVRAGTNIQSDGYFLSLSPFYGDVGLFKRVSGTQTQLGTSVAFGWAANTVTSWLIEAVGTTVRCKVWTGSEPGGYTISQTDTSHSSGWLGLSLDGGASTSQPYVAYWDNVEYPGPVRRPAVFSSAAGDRAEQLRMPRDVIVVQPRSAGGPPTTDVSVPSTFGISASATRGTTAAATVSAGLAITAAADVSIVAASTPITCRLEVELTAGVWTDITAYVAYRSGPVRIRQGRPTEYDDVGPAVMTLELWNDDGRFMPGNTASPFYPNFAKGKRLRWLVDKGGATFTRFAGPIQAIAPEFPGTSTVEAVVGIVATDPLGVLAQRKLRSNLTERSLWRARNDGTWCDAYEASGSTSGQIALMTNYSTDATPGLPNAVYGASDSAMNFGSENDLSAGGVCTASGAQTTKTIVGLQSAPLQIKLHLKGPTQQVGAGFAMCALFASGVASLAVTPNGASNGLFLRNAANTASVGIIGNLPFGQWCEVIAYSRAANPARSDWWMVLSDGTATILSDVAVDIRSVTQVWLPGNQAPSLDCSFSGVTALGTRTPVNVEEAFTGVANGTVLDRVVALSQAVDQSPVTIDWVGSLSGSAMTGRWSERSAAEVLQEILRSYSGIAWARPWDGWVYAIDASQLYPTTVVATLDSDGDCLGAPSLVDGAETRPTRIEVAWPGGTVSAIDRAAEAVDGIARSRRITTVAPTQTAALAAGSAILARADAGVRISQLELDLKGADTDHAPAVLSQAGTLGGLFPTARYRLAVPTSYFGVPTKDVHVQGWTETYGPGQASIRMDTSPAIATTLITETWPGVNGAAWSGQWSATSGGGSSGSTLDVQSGRGRTLAGAGGDVWRRITALSRADVEITGLVQVQGTAEAQVLWRSDSGLTNGYALAFSASGGVRVQQVVSGVISTRYTVWSTSGGTYGSGAYGSGTYPGSAAIVAGVDYRFRIRHLGAYLSIRAWAASDAEPGSWQLDVRDVLHAGPGTVALRQWVASQTALFDDIVITTGA